MVRSLDVQIFRVNRLFNNKEKVQLTASLSSGVCTTMLPSDRPMSNMWRWSPLSMVKFTAQFLGSLSKSVVKTYR